jgi:hypothetical protein
MDNRESIYRKAALERLTTPEELNEALRVTRPLDWLVLSTVALVCIAGLLWASLAKVPVTVHGQGILEPAQGTTGLYAPASGLVTDVWMREGDVAEAGEGLLRLCIAGCAAGGNPRPAERPGKPVHEGRTVYRDVIAPFQARIVELAAANNWAAEGSPVARIEPVNPPMLAILLVTPQSASWLQQGAAARIQLAGFAPQQVGLLQGSIGSISQSPMSDGAIAQLLRNAPQARSCIAANLRIPVKIRLALPESAGGGRGVPLGAFHPPLSHAAVTGEVVLRQEHPIAWIMPWLP